MNAARFGVKVNNRNTKMAAASDIVDHLRHFAAPPPPPMAVTKNNNISLEALYPVSHLAAAISSMTILAAVTVFVLLVFTRLGSKFTKVKRPFFVPRENSFVAQLISLSFFIKQLSAILTLMREPEEDQFFFTVVWAVNFGLQVAFVVMYVFLCDSTSAFVAAFVAFAGTVVECGFISDASDTATYVAMANFGFSLYWLVGVGKHWFQTEMKKAMQELEEKGWNVPGKESPKDSNKAAKRERRRAKQ